MLDHTLDAENSILFIRPRSSLSKSDCETLTKTVSEHLATGGALDGIISLSKLLDSPMGEHRCNGSSFSLCKGLS